MASEDDDEVNGSFEYTVDLVKFIRDEFDDYFTIAVAGEQLVIATRFVQYIPHTATV